MATIEERLEQPVARVETVKDTHFGVTVEDPYRWMEDWHGDELRRWVEAQGAHTRAYLDALPERQALLERITALGDATPLLTNFQIAGERTFYFRRDPGENVFKLVARAAPGAQEQVVFDPAEAEGEVHSVIDWYSPSEDGRLVVFGLSQGGSEQSVLHVLDVESGRLLDDRITRTMFGAADWVDDRSFVYHRLVELPEGSSQLDKYRDSRTYLHRLGDDPDRDQPIFGNGITDRVQLAREDIPFVSLPSRPSAPGRGGTDWMIGIVIRGTRPEVVLYAAPRAALSDPAAIPWVQVVDVGDRVASSFAVHGDTLYVKTFKDAPRYKIEAIDLKQPDGPHQTVVPPSEAVVEGIGVAGEYLIVKDLAGGLGRVRRVRLEDGEIEEVPLPVEGTISDLATSEESGEVILQLSSWLVSPTVYRFNATAPVPEDTSWAPPASVDMSELEAHETEYRSSDGATVPISIIHRKGLKRDGNNPTILIAYGSYGLSQLPAFRPTRLAWCERGGVMAVAHIRGGGEYGKEWHEAGRLMNKGNTIDDFIAAGEFLIREGYTRSERLAGMGGSAGGIPTGGSLVKRPDLWAVMVMMVAVVDWMRFEFSENGVNNTPEFGTVTTEEGFRALQIIDSYGKVRDGVKYPACLITTGLNDPRVVVWQATKMAARLQAATASGKPVLLRVESQGGHGIGSTRRQQEEELADIFTFCLAQFS